MKWQPHMEVDAFCASFAESYEQWTLCCNRLSFQKSKNRYQCFQ